MGGLASRAQREQCELFDVVRRDAHDDRERRCRGGNRVGPVTPVTPKLDTRAEWNVSRAERVKRSVGEARRSSESALQELEEKDRRPAHSGR